MSATKIEWTERTWNPITGCTKQSDGCIHCYAEIMSKRLQSMGIQKYCNGFEVTLHPESLTEPLKWKKASTIFVCSMGDLFHNNVPFLFIDKVIDVIRNTPRHNYQILTKRAERMVEYFETHDVPDNAWIGVTVENSNSKYRIDLIRNLNANVKFLSCEPLIDDLGDLALEGINWVIVGGESGVKARPMKEDWAINILKQARTNKIPFFFKQWGTWDKDGNRGSKKKNGKLLNNMIIQEMPIKKSKIVQ